eukprot:sb/3470157/
MTNQAVNPIVYIYSNTLIQKYFVRDVLPPCLSRYFFPSVPLISTNTQAFNSRVGTKSVLINDNHKPGAKSNLINDHKSAGAKKVVGKMVRKMSKVIQNRDNIDSVTNTVNVSSVASDNDRLEKEHTPVQQFGLSAVVPADEQFGLSSVVPADEHPTVEHPADEYPDPTVEQLGVPDQQFDYVPAESVDDKVPVEAEDKLPVDDNWISDVMM